MKKANIIKLGILIGVLIAFIILGVFLVGGSLKIDFFSFMIGSIIGIATFGLGAVCFCKGVLKLVKGPSYLAVTSIVAATNLFAVYYVTKKLQTD
jgi:hypothetical protein